MTPNPNCPGVPHRPDDPLYRAAVKRHAELGGTVEITEPLFDDEWLPIDRSLCQQLKFNQWGNGLEYRPAEPLRTDGYLNGMPDPGDGWFLLLKGKLTKDGDEVHINGGWRPAHEKKVINAAYRRRLTPEQAKSYDETAEEMRAAGDDGWDDVTDVDAELRKIRGPEIDTDSCDRIARMEAVVKRLANLDTTNNWPWRCELARLIEEAKELTDGQA